ncbi:MAG: hypothetical protein CVU57_07390 [Deltaproteobacteria bacterium HGW-Deltaproteobacteria-15]|jgi:IclR family KDG regulon transcriptional repressor|nr:MAG: hypothetical protein CVU57_07390 [Deltaproteobacteria bacterium HGW-Deltaproteobacteria-15]
MAFSKVNAVYKCFDILDLLARNNGSMGVSEIASAVDLHKSTVYNILNSLVDLGVLNKTENKYSFGAKLYLLGHVIDYESLVVRQVRPHMQRFSEETKLTTSFGIRAGMRLVVLERIELPGAITVATHGGKVRPLLDGAYGKAVLSILPDMEIQEILNTHELIKRTPRTVTDRKKYLAMIQKTRDEGVAIERGEFYEGIWGVAVPIAIPFLNTQAVIWAFGLEIKENERAINGYAKLLKRLATEIVDSLDKADSLSRLSVKRPNTNRRQVA